MVDRDVALFAFWLALSVGMVVPGLTLLVVFHQTKDAVPGMVGLTFVWLGVAFAVNAVIRCTGFDRETQLVLVAWQRACFAVTVMCGLFAADAIVRAHNGHIPRIRRLVRWWEAIADER